MVSKLFRAHLSQTQGVLQCNVLINNNWKSTRSCCEQGAGLPIGHWSKW